MASPKRSWRGLFGERFTFGEIAPDLGARTREIGWILGIFFTLGPKCEVTGLDKGFGPGVESEGYGRPWNAAVELTPLADPGQTWKTAAGVGIPRPEFGAAGAKPNPAP